MSSLTHPAGSSTASESRHAHVPALVAASGATFLAYLDVTVVNVAFPDLAVSFPGAGVETLSWIITAYAVAFAALLAAAGRLADRSGRRGVFLAGVAAFTVASALAAAAPSVELLIAARLIQGAGAAAMIPSALGVVLATSPPDRRAGAIAVWGATGSLAAALGPSLGGVLVDAFGWRSVFVLNLPFAALIVAVTVRRVAVIAGDGGSRPDLLGTVLLTVGIGATVVGLTQAGPWGWDDPRSLALLVGGALLVAGAVRRSLRSGSPAVDVRLLADRPFALATVAAALTGAALFAWLLFGVVFLTGVWGYSISETGLAVTPGATTAMLASLLAGRWAQAGHGTRAIVLGGALFAMTGVGLALATGPSPSYLAVWLPAGLLSGSALGMMMTGVVTSAAATLPPRHFAAGTGLNLTARQVGGALAVALAVSLVGSTGAEPRYDRVWVLCAIAGALCALAGAALGRTSAAPG